jgi:hypothetical protein
MTIITVKKGLEMPEQLSENLNRRTDDTVPYKKTNDGRQNIQKQDIPPKISVPAKHSP